MRKAPSSARATPMTPRNGRTGTIAGSSEWVASPSKEPVKEIGLAKALLQKAKALDDAGPAPSGVPRGQDVDLQYVARLRTFDPDGPGKRMNASAIDAQILSDGHPRLYLPAARVHALDLHFVTGLDAEPGFQRAVPHRVRGLGG